MSDTPHKRPWFQFHLSTAMVVMLVAGLLLGANIYLWEVDQAVDEWLTPPPPPPPSPTGMHSVTIVEISRDAYWPIPVLSVLLLVAVAVGCKWWARRRQSSRKDSSTS
jgi:hypothetical protein